MRTKTGRNDPCPCGSGRKYKKCHGASVKQPGAGELIGICPAIPVRGTDQRSTRCRNSGKETRQL
ncbi:SEC-C metal-binding domain-containing protein [Aromatoleum buckelii]|uniref:SEC-C metal-binding domain-containing protein n=1 Tax=Aromatoleum buckelii TaxID=200254 RepID=UPI001B7CE060